MNGEVLAAGTGDDLDVRALAGRLADAETGSTTFALDAFDGDEMVFAPIFTTEGTGSTDERWLKATMVRGSLHRVIVSRSPISADTAGTRARLLAAATEYPAGDVELPEVPQLSGNVVDDARALFGMTKAQLASLFGVTERQLYRWQRSGVPQERQREFDALVAVGVMVIGGLGPHGAGQWLLSGRPSGMELIQSGRAEQLRERALQLTDSPAT